jgi:hypothetical protein
MDLNALLKQLTGTAEQRQKSYADQAAQMAQQTAEMQNAMSINIDATRQVADEATRIATAEAEVVARQQEAAIKGQTILGLDPDNMENELISSMGEYDFAEAERKRTRQQFEQLNQISILDNPLAYIAAQLQLPQVAARNNELVAMRDAAANNIQTRQALLQQNKSAIVANTVDQVKKINLDKAANARRVADIQLREAQIENASKVAGQQLQIFQLTDKIYDIDSDLLNKKLQIGQYMMSLEERREARAERAAAAAERAKNKAAEEEDLAQLNLQFQRISQFLGLAVPMNVEIWKRIPDRKKQQAWLEAANTGTIGADLFSALQFISQQGNPGVLRTNNPGVAQAADGMTAAIDSHATRIQRAATARGEKLKPEEIIKLAESDYINEMIGAANRPGTGNSLTSPRWDSVFTPYRAQHKMLVDEVGSNERHPLQGNPFVEVIVSTLNTTTDKAAPNLPAADEQRALKLMAERVKNRQLTADQAATAISDYYRYSMAKNRDLYQYDLFNLPPQTRYFGQIDKLGVFGKAIEADLSDPLQVKKAIVEQVRSQTPQIAIPGFAVPSMRAAEASFGGAELLVERLKNSQQTGQ